MHIILVHIHFCNGNSYGSQSSFFSAKPLAVRSLRRRPMIDWLINWSITLNSKTKEVWSSIPWISIGGSCETDRPIHLLRRIVFGLIITQSLAPPAPRPSFWPFVRFLIILANILHQRACVGIEHGLTRTIHYTPTSLLIPLNDR